MTTTTPKPLTETQMLVLANAAQRSNLFVMPLPSTVTVRGSVKRNLILALLKIEMIQESVADDPAIAWRTGDDGKHFVLHLTPAGYLAVCPPIEVSTADASVIPADPLPARSSTNDNAVTGPVDVTKPEAPMRTPTGKLGQELQANSGGTGATLPENAALTGWLPHTARAALTGLRQRGFRIQLIEADGRKAYRRMAAA